MSNSSRVTVLAIGVCKYRSMQPLEGPKNDVDRLYDLLTMNESTATCSPGKFIRLIDPTSAKVRKTLAEYALSRSAPNDILILYFSGHGVYLTEDDFGFCTTDTQFLKKGDEHIPIPLNLVRFGGVIETLSAVAVDPVIVLDACYSGQAGERIEKLYSDLENRTKRSGGAYALLCACTKYETTQGIVSGGLFSTLLDRVAREGVGDSNYKRKAALSLNDLFPILKEEAERLYDFTPRYFCSKIPLDFAFVRNVKFRANILSISSFVGTLKLFWNNGRAKKLSVVDLQKIGSTVHTTYSKLSYGPAWELLDKGGRGKSSWLSERGIRFMKNEILIPEKIEQDPATKKWNKAKGSRMVSLHDIVS